MARLGRDFFQRDTISVARDLLGAQLVYEIDGERVAGRIVEVEAYTGFDDHASHGFRGPTPRNSVMFGIVGVTYVYLCYGVHWLLNVIAKPDGVEYPAAVLLRAVEPLEGLHTMAQRRFGRREREWTNGPGRLTAAMGINKQHSGLNTLDPVCPLYFEGGETIAQAKICAGPRIGINAPEPSKSLPWRFWIKDNPYVSNSKRK